MPLNKNMAEFCTCVCKLNRVITDYTQQVIESDGVKDLHPSAGVILLPLLERQGQTLSELAGYVHMKAPTITVIANRLEKRGLIRRERGSADRREVHLYLTREGSRLAELLQGIHMKVMQRMSTGIAKSNIVNAGEVLNLIIDNLSDKRD